MLILTHPDVFFGVDETLAMKMKWFAKDDQGDTVLGPNVVPELPVKKDGSGDEY